MAEEIDYDSMTDEEFIAAMDEAAALPNDYEEEEVDNTSESDDIEDQEDNEDSDDINEDEDDNDDVEDTDHSEDDLDENDDETDTEDSNDGEDPDTDEDDNSENDDTDEENAQNEDNSSNEEGNNNDVNTDSEDDTETNDTNDGDGQDTEAVDYKEEYSKLKDFYDKITSEFTANGKKMKGFTDPDKIIQSQQMAAGFSEKMAAFKPYRPLMAPLKERGLLEDTDKFNLAMDLLDGDVNAIKQHIKTLDIDPLDLDMDSINYTSKIHTASAEEITLDDVMQNATSYGVQDKVREVLGEQWDKESVIDLLRDPQSSADIVDHISTGAFDAVQDRIAEKKRVDHTGAYSNKIAIEQYREAAQELEREYAQRMMQESQQADADKAAKVEAEKARIEEERKKAAYKAKVEQENIKTNDARKKAASVSSKKPKKTPKKKEFNLDELDDKAFNEYLDSLMYTQ